MDNMIKLVTIIEESHPVSEARKAQADFIIQDGKVIKDRYGWAAKMVIISTDPNMGI